jgi:tetratricopeptide (TPR) repeat protein
MKQLLLSFLLLFFVVAAKAQSEADKFIEQGIALHDKGDYDAAIAKYDEALRVDPTSYMAMYEKSYAYMAMKKYDESETMLKKILKECKDPAIRKLCFVNYGTILDYKGEGKKSLKMYDEGIKEFPEHYLLHFNKGITQSGMGESGDALESFKNSLRCNPYHASSHHAAGRTVANSNRIPGILAMFSFLLIEPEGKRAEQNLDLLNKLIMKGVSSPDGKNVNISIDASLLDKKNKKKDDDFSSAELMLSLVASSNSVPDSLGAKTDADRLSYKLQLLTGLITETDKKDKGFFKTFYVPFFAEMKKKDFMTTACYIALSSSGKEDIEKWIEDYPLKIELFYDWFEKFSWAKQ